jgi:hypothetical protein
MFTQSGKELVFVLYPLKSSEAQYRPRKLKFTWDEFEDFISRSILARSFLTIQQRKKEKETFRFYQKVYLPKNS